MQAVIECQASLRIATPSVTAANTLGPEGGLFTRSGSAAHPFLVKLPASAYRRQAQGGTGHPADLPVNSCLRYLTLRTICRMDHEDLPCHGKLLAQRVKLPGNEISLHCVP
jgi:hypothetical protein